MKYLITLFTTLLLLGWSVSSWAFTCKNAGGSDIGIGGGAAYVDVTLSPMISAGQNLVVNLSQQIFCYNDRPDIITDYVSLSTGSAFSGVLQNFSGTVRYNGTSYPFPLRAATSEIIYNSSTPKPWPVMLYLTPVSTAAGVVIEANSVIAALTLHLRNSWGRTDDYVWYIRARNRVVMPTGGCDVSARNVSVTLPTYPGSAAIPLTVRCGQNQQLAYYLSGTTADTGNTIFTNTAASAQAAQGLGIQLLRNGNAIATSQTVPLGTVGTAPVSLGLSATYKRTSGQVTAGNVQSIIGVTFVYQ
jgi:minor fimbrial subunit